MVCYSRKVQGSVGKPQSTEGEAQGETRHKLPGAPPPPAPVESQCQHPRRSPLGPGKPVEAQHQGSDWGLATRATLPGRSNPGSQEDSGC